MSEKKALRTLVHGMLFLMIEEIIVLAVLSYILWQRKILTLDTKTVVISIAVLFLLIFGYLYLEHGFNTLIGQGKYVREGRYGATNLLRSLILFIISGIFALVSFNEPNERYLFILISTVFLITGFILQFIGNISLGIGFRQIGEIYAENHLKNGGSLLISAVILAVIILSAFIIMFNILFKYYEVQLLILLPFIIAFISFVEDFVGLKRIIDNEN